MTDYPLNPAESHEYLQERQGWKVSDMRLEIDSLKRQLNSFQAPIRNALNLLRLVNCGHVDQAKVNQAISVLEDIDKRKAANEL